MPALPVIPEADVETYDSYARKVAKRRRKRDENPARARKSLSVVKFTPNFVSKRQQLPDYYGLDNSMKKLSLSKTRKWRTREAGRDRKLAWHTAEKEDKQGKPKEDVKAPAVACDRHDLRQSRSFLCTKFKYPEKYHDPSRIHNVHLEENIPQCLRKSPRYSNLPVRQSCLYKPIRSVTQLSVHSIRSSCLPHPAPDGTVTKRRRPTSAPPGTVTSSGGESYAAAAAAAARRDGSFERSYSCRRHSCVDKAAGVQHVSFDGDGDDLQRNGSFAYQYGDGDVDEATHVTLEVQESDDEGSESGRSNPAPSSHQATGRDGYGAEAEAEAGAESAKRTKQVSESGNRRQQHVGDEAPSPTQYTDDYETESAKSVDSEQDRL